jgi:hypothetical protein
MEFEHLPICFPPVETGLAPSPVAIEGTGGASGDAASRVSTVNRRSAPEVNDGFI